jgi:hypothetical protein
MTEEREQRVARLYGLVREAGLEDGGHPPAEQLFAYQEGLLAGGEEAEVQDHLSLCPDCARRVLELSGAAEPEAPATELPLSEERLAELWPGMRRRLPLPFQAGTAPRRRFSERVAPALAASLLLATVGTSLWAWSLHRQNGRLAGPRVNVEVRDLLPLGEGEARGGREGEAGVPRGSEAVLLVLNLDDLRSFPAYRAEIRELPAGKLVWAGSDLRRSRRGNFTVQLPVPFPGSGRYRIRLLGVEGDRRELLATYEVDLGAAR